MPDPDQDGPSAALGSARAAFIVLLASTLLLGVALAVASGTRVAGAHSILIRTDPAPGDRLDGLEAVRLEFAHDVAATGHVVTLHRQGAEVAVASAYELPEPNTVVAGFDQPLPAGDYEIVWDVVAGDGHHERGRIPITLTAPATGPATTAAEVPAAPADDQEGTLADGTARQPGGDAGDEPAGDPADGGAEPAVDQPGDPDGMTGSAGDADAGADGDDTGGGPFVLRLAIAAAVLAAFAYWRRRRPAGPRAGRPLERS